METQFAAVYNGPRNRSDKTKNFFGLGMEVAVFMRNVGFDLNLETSEYHVYTHDNGTRVCISCRDMESQQITVKGAGFYERFVTHCLGGAYERHGFSFTPMTGLPSCGAEKAL